MAIDYALNYADMFTAVSSVLEAKLVPFITSAPGQGKSALVKDLADKYNMELIDIRLSMLEPSDINGLPNFTKEGKAYFAPFNVFPLENTPLPEGKEAFLIFLDEFNAASKQTAAAAYKLVLDRQVGNYNLHPDCYIVCAGNRSSDRAITNNLGTALQTRLIHLSLEVEYQAWMDTVAIPQKYDYRITSFLAQYPALLNNFNPEHTVNTYAVPRTWEFTNRLIKDKEITPLHSAVLAGTIGTEVALQFIQYSKVYEGLPTIASIVADPATALLPTDTPSKWAILSLLLENANEENIGMFAMYSERFGMDLRVYFLRCIAKQHPTLMRHPKLSQTIMELSRYLHS